MAKNRDVLIAPTTGDISISTQRNRLGLIEQGLIVGDTTVQNQAIILQSGPGQLKEYPTLGCDISSLVNDDNIIGWKREITLQLEADGMTVNEVTIDIHNNKISIDAEYRS